ncbi:Uncharacterized conserved protein [Phaffia rhodozyma]|uniref:Uncharacterized conserved protein n=1 Tax=Phaffia rhodozyma TaxID=264483 RepID=A0A0F7SIW5_PHARH|nr:Uncharacterized conserved protein [Phaffia rhodozyma]
MLNTCPVCTEEVETATLKIYQNHVSAHFDDPIQCDQAVSELNDGQELEEVLCQDGSMKSSSGQAIICPVCACSIEDLQVEERSAHVASHFDEEDYESPQESNSPATHKPNSMRPTVKRDRRDISWSSVHSPLSSLPPNYSPNLIPLLYQVLSSSDQTRSAVLCSPHGTTHIRSRRGWDFTWGCGFRNFQMCFSALGHPLCPGGGVDDGEGVSVWTLQSWIEDAWREGFDEVGKSQFKGKMRGVRRWIGAADIWVGLMCAGIQCHLYDFPKAGSTEDQPPHVVLQRWVINYFNSGNFAVETTKGGSAFDMMMKSRGQSVKISNKLPLILQHQGHSRTIVGYETLSSGETNLLLFDPAKTVPDHLRKLAIEELKNSREQAPSSSGPSSVEKRTDCDPSPADNTNDRSISGFEPQSPAHLDDNGGSEVERVKANTKEEDWGHRSRSKLSSTMLGDEHMEIGVSRKKRRAKVSIENGREKRWRKDVGAALSCFRVNLKTLKRNSEYQILAFSGGPILPQKERDKHRVVDFLEDRYSFFNNVESPRSTTQAFARVQCEEF